MHGNTGRKSARAIDMTGVVCGKLTVLKRANTKEGGGLCWECSCECGNSYIARGRDLRNGKRKSCGCLSRQALELGRFPRLTEDEKTRRLRDYKFKYKYGITLETRDLLATIQKQQCAICKSCDKLYVDHDHESGRVRGLLCRTCNLMIGLMNDNSDVLRRAAEYLDNNVHILATEYCTA